MNENGILLKNGSNLVEMDYFTLYSQILLECSDNKGVNVNSWMFDVFWVFAPVVTVHSFFPVIINEIAVISRTHIFLLE